MKTQKLMISAIMFMFLFSLCRVNSVSKEQLENVKPGDILVYRYQKADGKTWFYSDKITRIEGPRIFYYPSKRETTSSHDSRLGEFLTDQELSVTKEEILKFTTVQGTEKKVIIRIK